MVFAPMHLIVILWCCWFHCEMILMQLGNINALSVRFSNCLFRVTLNACNLIEHSLRHWFILFSFLNRIFLIWSWTFYKHQQLNESFNIQLIKHKIKYFLFIPVSNMKYIIWTIFIIKLIINLLICSCCCLLCNRNKML